jgi:hypothetical protein
MPDEQPLDLVKLIEDGASFDSLTAAGAGPEAIIGAIRKRGEDLNRAQQSTLPYPLPQPDADWEARKAWLLDGQRIHGEVKDFYLPALAALKADDQVTYSRQRDLLFKALWFLDNPPPLDPASVVEALASQAASQVTNTKP